MKKILLLFSGIALTLSIGCGTIAKKTDLLPVPPARTGGHLSTPNRMLAPLFIAPSSLR